jgi:glycosyltransferase involved in cell wall biosynthesis
MKPLVTVLIPFYNPGRYLKKAVDSVFEQFYTNWKLLLVNDASTDKSETLLGPYLNDSRVTLISNQKNLGQSKALNIGLDNIDTKYFIQLDADDWFPNHTLEVLLNEALTQAENTALITGNITFMVQNRHGQYVNSLTRKGCSFSDKYEFLLANRSVWPRFYRTEAVKTVGGWPVDGPFEGRYYEDIRILLRLIEHYQFHWVDEGLLYHRRHTENQTNKVNEYAQEIEWTIRNTLKKWGDEFTPIFENKAGWKHLERLEYKKPPSPTLKKLIVDESVISNQDFSQVRNSFTIECWVKPENSIELVDQSRKRKRGLQGQNYLIGPKITMNRHEAGIGISIGTNGITIFEQKNDSLVATLVYQTKITEWIHVTVVYKQRVPYLFLNGKLVKKGTKGITRYIFPSLPSDDSNEGKFIGGISEVKIWNYERKDEQIKENWNKPLNEIESGLIGYWSL